MKPIEEARKDEESEAAVVTEIKLFRCSDEDGTLKVTEVKKGPLYQSDLNSDDSFFVDNGPNGILFHSLFIFRFKMFHLYFLSGVFVWVGKKASKQERSEAMTNGQSFAKKKEFPVSTNVVRVIDGGEPAEFKALFRDWKNRDQTVGLGNRNSSRNSLHQIISFILIIL